MTAPPRRRATPLARSRAAARPALSISVSRERGVTGPSDPTVARVVRLVLRSEGVRRATLSIALVANPTIRRLNARFFRRRRTTDVIAFPLIGTGGATVGDVYVAPAVAARSASALGIAVREEVLRLVVHGVLHVLGRDHPEGPGRSRSAMWRRQEALLARALGQGGR